MNKLLLLSLVSQFTKEQERERERKGSWLALSVDYAGLALGVVCSSPMGGTHYLKIVSF